MAQSVVTPSPSELPTPEDAIAKFVKWRDRPSKLLPTHPAGAGIAPIDLFRAAIEVEIDRVWFVGSCVWYPAVLGRIFPENTDIDIVFYSKDAMHAFTEAALAKFRAYEPNKHYFTETNKHNGSKFKRTSRNNTTSFMDIWHLPEHTTIHEHIMGFKHDHEHVAMLAGVREGDVAGLTRIVHPHHWPESDVRREPVAETWTDYSS